MEIEIKKNHVYEGDALEILSKFPSNSVQCAVTSPPYWKLRDYNVKNQLGQELKPEEYVEKLVLIFRELRRVLKENGVFFLNLGDCFFKSGSPKSIYKLKPKDQVGIPWRVAFALQADGWYFRSDIVWYKPNASPEGSVYDRPTKAHEFIFLMTKSARYYWNLDAIRIPNKTKSEALSGIANDYSEIDILESQEQSMQQGMEILKSKIKTELDTTGVTRKLASLHQKKRAQKLNPKGKNIRSVWIVNTKPDKQSHFAVYPPELITPCIKVGSAPGDIILDPFMGSGTTGRVALDLGRNYVGIELNPESIKISQQKLEFKNAVIDW